MDLTTLNRLAMFTLGKMITSWTYHTHISFSIRPPVSSSNSYATPASSIGVSTTVKKMLSTAHKSAFPTARMYNQVQFQDVREGSHMKSEACKIKFTRITSINLYIISLC